MCSFIMVRDLRDLGVIHILGKQNDIADPLSHGIFKGIGYDYWEVISAEILHVSL